jgi:hypothetical protein
MLYRHEYIREDASLAVTDTFRVDLPKQGLLSSLLFRLSANDVSGLAQLGGSWRLLDFISKVAIIANGATIIKSLDAAEIDALAFYDEGVMPPDTWRNYASNTQFMYMQLNFGRWKGDPGIGLDLGKFANVELQITNTMTALTHTTPAVSILGCYVVDPSPNQFAGYLRTEEWRKWTTVADETKYHELDLEYRIRRIMLRAVPDVDANNVSGTGMSNLMDDVDLSLDTGVTRLHKGGIDDIMRLNYYNYGKEILTSGFPYVNADKGFDMGVGYATGAVAGAGSQDGAGAATIPTIESARTDNTQKAETYEGDNPLAMFVRGVGPFNTAMLRFDYDDEPPAYLDPMARRQVLLNIHTRNAASAADGSNFVILDRYVPYGR